LNKKNFISDNTWKEHVCTECVDQLGHCPMRFYSYDIVETNKNNNKNRKETKSNDKKNEKQYNGIKYIQLKIKLNLQRQIENNKSTT
jgi:hypothetical protein